MPSLLFHSGFFNAPLFVTLALAAILIAASVYDIKTFTIPHIFPYAIAALFAVNIIVSGMSLSWLPWHFLSVIIAFLIGSVLFAFRLMGGGDVKIFAALAIWFFPLGLIGLIFCITMVGLIIGLGVSGMKLIPSASGLNQKRDFSAHLKSIRKTRIPYGPSIAIGTIIYLLLSNNFGV